MNNKNTPIYLIGVFLNLNKIKKVINKIESGKKLTEKDIEGLN